MNLRNVFPDQLHLKKKLTFVNLGYHNFLKEMKGKEVSLKLEISLYVDPYVTFILFYL